MKQFEYKLDKDEAITYVIEEQKSSGVTIKKDGQTNHRERRKNKRK